MSRSASLMMTRVYSRRRRVQQLALEQLRRAAQAAERIFDLVRQLPHHEAAAAQLREQGVLAGQAPVLGDVLDFQQQAAALWARAVISVTAQSRMRSVPPGAGPGELALHDALRRPAARVRTAACSVSAPRLKSVMRRPERLIR